jgi:microcystin-dependent protein
MRQIVSTALVAVVVGAVAGATMGAVAQSPAQEPGQAIVPSVTSLNAHRVDGRHAVSAKASRARRAGKLVATNKQGLLPANIIRPAWGLIQGKPARTKSTGGGQAHTNMQPFVTLDCIIALEGIFPSRNGGGSTDSAFLGEVKWFAGNFAPRGWAFCDGQLLSIAQHSALFSILGTTYGGDGRQNFALPDARGRAILHEGSGPGLSPRTLGQKAGQQAVALNVSQMPNHDHTITP